MRAGRTRERGETLLEGELLVVRGSDDQERRAVDGDPETSLDAAQDPGVEEQHRRPVAALRLGPVERLPRPGELLGERDAEQRVDRRLGPRDTRGTDRADLLPASQAAIGGRARLAEVHARADRRLVAERDVTQPDGREVRVAGALGVARLDVGQRPQLAGRVDERRDAACVP